MSSINWDPPNTSFFDLCFFFCLYSSHKLDSVQCVHLCLFLSYMCVNSYVYVCSFMTNKNIKIKKYHAICVQSSNSYPCCQTSTYTLCIFSIFSAFTHYIGGHFPVYALILILGFGAALAVFFTSKNEEPPVYHPVSNNNNK